MDLSRSGAERSLRVHVWVPELVSKRGGIQTFSRCLIEALADILGSDQVRVMAKNDPGMKSEEHGAGSGSQGASDAALRQSISREHSARTSGSRNFTAGVRESGGCRTNRTREAGDSVSVKTEGVKREDIAGRQNGDRGWGHWPASLRTVIFFFGIIWQALRDRPQLVISTHLNFGIAGYAVKLLTGVPYWCVAHGVEAWNLHRYLPRLGLLKSDLVLAVSNYTRERLLNEQPLTPQQVVVLPNTIDPDAIKPGPKPDYLMRRHALTVCDKVILTVARLAEPERYKGYDQVLRALPAIRTEIPDLKYILVGEGEDRSRIEALVRDLNLCDAVVLAGGVPQKELADYYNLCDVFAMPSKGEGFGIVYLEALVCGKPVLAGNSDGSSEPLQNGELGILVNVDDVGEIAQKLVRVLREQGAGGKEQGAGSRERGVGNGEWLREETLRKFGFGAFKARLSALLESRE
jgi:glycosyltransferase involved in cell wall biosynthesis